MSDQPYGIPTADENIREFMEVHGTEGFFILYFKKFIYQFVINELKSPSDEVESASLFLFSKSESEVPSVDNQELRDQCEVWARDLVESLKNDPVLREIIESGDIHRLHDEEERVREVMHQRFVEWEDQSEELLEEVKEEL